MSIRYELRVAVIGPHPVIDLSAREFQKIQQARRVLNAALAIEEKYEILIANFLSLEQTLLSISVTSSVRWRASYSEHFGTRSSATICFVNLLTSARLYLEQVLQDVEDARGAKSKAVAEVKRKCSQEYDQFFEYRFMEALRNHVQHRGVPIHTVMHRAEWTSFDEVGGQEYSTDVFATRKALAEIGGFKASVLNEMPDKVDLLAACRRYVESISEVHELARSQLASEASRARRLLKRMQSRYGKSYKESLVGLVACEIDGAHERSVVYLNLSWDDVRIDLRRRNPQLVNLHKRYVTSRSSANRPISE